MTRRCLMAFMLMSALVESVAHAGALCDRGALFQGPLQIGLAPGDQGLGRTVCARTGFSIALGANALLDTPNFFGTLAGTGTVRGSYSLGDRLVFFGSWDTAQYRFIQNATLSESKLSVGTASVGAQWQVWRSERYAIAPALRLVLPTSSVYLNTVPFAADLMLLAQWNAFETVAFHGELGLTGSAAFSAGDMDSRLGFTMLAGAQWNVRPWFAGVAEAGAVLGSAATPTQVTVAPGLRFGWSEHYALELCGIVPVAGTTRTTFAGALRFGWRL